MFILKCCPSIFGQDCSPVFFQLSNKGRTQERGDKFCIYRGVDIVVDIVNIMLIK